MNYGAFSALAVVIISSFYAHGSSADQPKRGRLHGQSSGGILIYGCEPTKDDRMPCELLQIDVAQKSHPDGWAQRLIEFKDLWNRPDGVIRAEMLGISCALADAAAGREIRGDLPFITDKDFFVSSIPDILPHRKPLFDAAASACQMGLMESMADFFKEDFIEDTMTCTLSARSSQAEFVKISDDVWTQVDEPSGPCGIVATSRFVWKSDGMGRWHYIQNRVITNPEGVDSDGRSCSMIDANHDVYTSDTWLKPVNCTYIE